MWRALVHVLWNEMVICFQQAYSIFFIAPVFRKRTVSDITGVRIDSADILLIIWLYFCQEGYQWFCEQQAHYKNK